MIVLSLLCRVRSWVHEFVAVLLISFATNIAATQAVTSITNPLVWPFSFITALAGGILALIFAQELRASEAEWARERTSTTLPLWRWTFDDLRHRKSFVWIAYLLPITAAATVFLIAPSLATSQVPMPTNPPAVRP